MALLCGEFGVYRQVAPPADRLRDVRRALESHDIGWAVWEYVGGFGIVEGAPGSRVIDAPSARALLDP